MRKVSAWILVLNILTTPVLAQEADSLLLGSEDELNSLDSLSIFKLIDSLLTLGDVDVSQLAFRLSYNSNVLSAGQTLGINNFGLSPAVSYYHKSGAYADLSGFWSTDFSPSYYLTTVSAGYMRDFSKHFSVITGFDHYFYHFDKEDVYIPYNNSISATPILEWKPVSLSLNYSFYFGDQYAHRVMPGLSILLQKKKFLKIDRISISPAFYLLWGNEVLTTLETVLPQNRLEARENWRLYGTFYKTIQHDRDVFGIMNYTFSAPLFVSHKNWSFSFTYAYYIPVALPGIPQTLSNSSYLSGSVAYYLAPATK
jgi:hypothetical protein